MATKDYVYLALIAFAAIVFYWNGFYAGASRNTSNRKRTAQDPSTITPFPDPVVSITTLDPFTSQDRRSSNRPLQPIVATDTVHCFFGNN